MIHTRKVRLDEKSKNFDRNPQKNALSKERTAKELSAQENFM